MIKKKKKTKYMRRKRIHLSQFAKIQFAKLNRLCRKSVQTTPRPLFYKYIETKIWALQLKQDFVNFDMLTTLSFLQIHDNKGAQYQKL